jgi:hypothetical protein
VGQHLTGHPARRDAGLCPLGSLGFRASSAGGQLPHCPAANTGDVGPGGQLCGRLEQSTGPLVEPAVALVAWAVKLNNAHEELESGARRR